MTAGTRKERYEITNLGLGHRPQNGGYDYEHTSCGPFGKQDTRRNGTLDYYFHEKIRKNDYKGVGPLLLLETCHLEE
ncbi:MAG: hypothetical protein LUH20_08495 [Lachnospiraceae bacterium]|nr:hypothetical protein [Lachnospiraceae bacterium]